MPTDRRPHPLEGTRTRRRRRDRHGRGLRGELAPRGVPLARTRAETFDDLVLDAVEDLEQQWTTELAQVQFAVEDVPESMPPSVGEFDREIVTDRGVALGRLYRDGQLGVPQPVIVIYRRPVESRSTLGTDRSDLVFAVVAELVAELLGRDIDEIDPPG